MKNTSIRILKRTKFLILLLIFASVIMLSCANPFDTRNVETPDNNPTYQLPSTPAALLNNITEAFEKRDEVLYNNTFQDSLSTDFIFYFIGDADNYQFLGYWTLSRELEHFSLIVKSYDELNLTFGAQFVEDYGDSILVHIPYEIKTVKDLKNQYFRGEVLFKMKYYLSYLIIYGWEDFKNSSTVGDSTWTRLKRSSFN